MSDRRGTEPWRSRTAQALLLGMLTLSPIELDFLTIEPPPAAVLPIGDPMPSIVDRRLAASLRLGL